MGRGPGKNNLSDTELKKKKAERDSKFYHAHRQECKDKYQLAKKNAQTITCGCGATYKDIPQLKNSHFSTQRHSCYDEEERLQVRQLICKKVKGVNTLVEARTKLENIYFDNKRYNYAQKEGYLPKLVTRLNKMEDKAPPPKKVKLVIKRKLNIIKEE